MRQNYDSSRDEMWSIWSLKLRVNYFREKRIANWEGFRIIALFNIITRDLWISFRPCVRDSGGDKIILAESLAGNLLSEGFIFRLLVHLLMNRSFVEEAKHLCVLLLDRGIFEVKHLFELHTQLVILGLETDGLFEASCRVIKVIKIFVSLGQSIEGLEVSRVDFDGILGSLYRLTRLSFLDHAECKIGVDNWKSILSPFHLQLWK